MYKIAFLGDEKSLSLYRPSGFSLFSPLDGEEAEEIIRKLQKGIDYAIIFVTEDIYTQAKSFIDSLDAAMLPAVIVMPGYGENDNVGKKRLTALTENAIGLSM